MAHSDQDCDLLAHEDPEHLQDSYSDEEEYRRKKRTHNLRFTIQYCVGWGPGDGIREIMQNFFDGICSTFNRSIEDVEFQYTQEGGDGKNKWIEQWIAKTKGSGKNGKPFGRIRHNLITQKLRVTNFDVTLDESVLLTGSSSKRGMKNQIGGHGEGMKLGILRLVVNGSEVRYRTGGQIWTFFLKKAWGSRHHTLHYRTTDSKKCKDLDVFITKVKKQHFLLENFLPLSEEAQSPLAISSCPKGQLIDSSDPRLSSSRVYVNGLFVWKNPNLRVSVNLTCACVNRDRELIIADNIFKEDLAIIWTQTFKNEAQLDDRPFTKRFLHLVRKDHHCLESDATEYMEEEVATYLRAQILKETPEAFPFKEGAEQEEKLICSSLQKTPYPVSERLLTLLQKDSRVLSVHATQENAFRAESSRSPPHVYELPLARMIKAFALKVYRESPDEIDVEFHKTSGSSIETLLKDGKLFCSESLVDVHFENEADALKSRLKAVAKIEQELKKGKDEDEASRILYEMMAFIASEDFRSSCEARRSKLMRLWDILLHRMRVIMEKRLR